MNPELMMVADFNTKYAQEKNCNIMKSAYIEDNSPAIVITTESHEVLVKATVHLDVPPSKGCVWIKTWAENEGVLEELVRLDVVETTGREEIVGHGVIAREAKVLL